MVGEDLASRRIDVLASGLFGLAVGALTLGVAQLGGIPESDGVGTLIIALIFGGGSCRFWQESRIFVITSN